MGKCKQKCETNGWLKAIRQKR